MKRVKYQPCKFCKMEVRTTQKKCPFCGRYLFAHIKESVNWAKNKEIVEAREKGETLRSLGPKYNLSAERIRTIERDFKDREESRS